MAAPVLTEAMIRQYASGESFRRGRDYYERGAVLAVVQRGKVIEAQVRGSEVRPYTVRCVFDERGAPHATCTCPYDWGGWCKHIVAVCLSMIRQPGKMEEHPALETLLDGLDRDQLQALLLKLAERDSSLPNVIEGLLVRTTITTTQGRPVPIDPAMVRRQVEAAFQQGDDDEYDEYDDDWYGDDENEYDAIYSGLEEILERIQAAIVADEGYSALLSLQAFTEAMLVEKEFIEFQVDIGSDLLYLLGKVWTGAVVSTELSSEERKLWIKKLDDWMMELEDVDEGEIFAAAQDAVARGWGYPPLQRVLRGESEQRAWESEAPDYADELTEARLNVLERRGRLQEYVNLAKAEGHTDAYLRMLVKLGQSDEAVAYGLRNLETADQALRLANELDEHGRPELSLQIAERGLGLQGVQTPLAKWLREKAATAGRQDLALRAAIQAFQDEVTLANYLRVHELAGEQWENMKDALRAHALEKSQSDESIDIFLHEGLIDEAIAAVKSHTSQAAIEKVVEAALPTRTEWAISTSRGRAETLIQQGAGYYETVARWLAKARVGYQQLGALDEWREYLGELIQQNRRKYKLVREIEILR